jgi:hypothetical protein
VAVEELILHKLLPMAAEGLARWGVDASVSDRYLSVLENRAVSGQTGAAWQVEATRLGEERGLTRKKSLERMLRGYRELSAANEPVHSWPRVI